MIRWLVLAVLAVLATPAHAQDQANVVASCGSVTLTAGQQSFRTIDLNGVTCNSGGAGGGGSPVSVWNASDAIANGMTITNGGITVSSPAAPVNGAVRGRISHKSGKYYFEIRSDAVSTFSAYEIGLASSEVNVSDTGGLGGANNYSAAGAFFNGTVVVSSGFTASGAVATYPPAANDIFQVAADLTAGKVWIGLNNVWYSSGAPGTGTSPIFSIVAPALGKDLFPVLMANGQFPTGTWTIKGSASSQKYPPPTGFLAWDTQPGCPESRAYLTRTTNGDEGGNADSIHALICGLVTDGVWGKFDAFYLLAQRTQADANLNLIGPNYTLPTTTATFKPYQGYSAFTPGGINTSFNLSTSPTPRMGVNNASAMAWAYDAADAGIQMGSSAGAGAITIAANVGQFYCLLSTAGAGSFVATPGTTGLFGCDRTSGTSQDFYWNGASVGNVALGTGPLDNTNIFIGSRSGGGPATAKTISEVNFGASLGAAGEAALSARLHTYMANAGNCAEAAAYLARTTGGNAGGNAGNIKILICSLVSDGIWDKLDALYLPAQQNVADARLNLVSASYPLVGTATFTAYRGFSGFAVGGLDTGFNPATAIGAKFTQNSGSTSGWTSTVGNGFMIGVTLTGGYTNLVPYTFGYMYCAINNNTDGYIASGGQTGTYACDRSASTSIDFWSNGVKASTGGQASVAPYSADLLVGSRSGDQPYTGTISEISFGGSLGDAGQVALDAELHIYMTAIGNAATSKPGPKPPDVANPKGPKK